MGRYKKLFYWMGVEILKFIQALMIPVVNIMGLLAECYLRIYYFLNRG